MAHQETRRRTRQNAITMRKTMTPAELALWKRLRRDALGVRFRRQCPIGPYVADFVSLRHKVIVEADGSYHDWSEDYDQARSAYLEHQGFRVLRFTNHDLAMHLDWVIQEIAASLR